MQITNNKKQRTCILILGMHRSGTSALAGCMSLLGFYPGKNLIPPDESNKKGYFENNILNQYNDKLLEGLYARWYDTLFLPDEWWKEETIISEQKKLKNILETEFGTEEKILIKDPRISVLLPYYLDVLSQLNITPKVIISYRHPFEVANSLRKRDNLSMSKSLLLWMDAILKAELYSRSFPRIFLYFNSLLEDADGILQKISDSLKLNIDIDSEKKILLKNFIERKLRHHRNIELPEESNKYSLIISLFTKLLELNLKPPSEPDKKEFDLFSKLFYSNFQFYNGIDSKNEIILKTVTENTTITYAEKFKSGENLIVFDTKDTNTVHEIILYPASRRLALHLEQVVLTTILGEDISVKPTQSNAEIVMDNGNMVFESEFPCIRFQLAKPQAIVQISVSFRFLAMDSYTYRLSILYRDILEAKYYGEIEELQQENSRLQLETKELVKTLQQEYETEINNIQLKIKNSLSQNTVLGDENIKLKNQVAKVESTSVFLKDQLNKQKFETSKLSTQIAKQDKENTILIEQIKYLKIENAGLVKEKTDFLNNRKELISTIKRLTNYNERSLSNFERSLEELRLKQQQLVEEKNNLISKYQNELIEERTKHNKSVNELKLEMTEMSEQLDFINSTLDEITNSKSWKIGRFLTWLIRKPKEKLRDRE